MEMQMRSLEAVIELLKDTFKNKGEAELFSNRCAVTKLDGLYLREKTTKVDRKEPYEVEMAHKWIKMHAMFNKFYRDAPSEFWEIWEQFREPYLFALIDPFGAVSDDDSADQECDSENTESESDVRDVCDSRDALGIQPKRARLENDDEREKEKEPKQSLPVFDFNRNSTNWTNSTNSANPKSTVRSAPKKLQKSQMELRVEANFVEYANKNLKVGPSSKPISAWDVDDAFKKYCDENKKDWSQRAARHAREQWLSGKGFKYKRTSEKGVMHVQHRNEPFENLSFASN